MSPSSSLIPVAEAEAPFFVGVDVGGTNVKFGLLDNQGRTLGRQEIRTESQRGPEDAVLRMAQSVRALVAEAGISLEELAAVGLATPGTMDVPAGMILEPPNLPTWRHFPIRDRLSEACAKPVAFANDANAAAFGEYWVGSGKGSPSIVMLTLGTGVGGGHHH